MTLVRVYAVAIRLLPRVFRERYGAQMLAMFDDERRDTTGAARAGVVLRAFRDLLWTALVVRVSDEYAGRPADDPKSSGWLTGVGGEVRAATRGLVRRPLFALTAIVTISLGIGATAAVFSVVDSTVLRGLSLRDPQRTVGFWTEFVNQPGAEFLMSAAELADVRSDLKSFDRVGAWTFAEATMVTRADGQARTVDIAQTYGDLYGMVGARAAIGRLPTQADDRPGAARVAVLSHEFWQQSYGGRSDVIGNESISLGPSESALIVGVATPGSELPGTTADVWVHEVLEPADYSWGRSGHGMSVIARLRDGATVESARAEIKTLESVWARRYAGQHSPGLEGHTIRVADIATRVLGTARKVALVLSVATLLLLGLACANVANLLLARGESRMTEVGVRLALGSTRMRVARPVLLEGMLVSLLGGVLGLALAHIGMPLLLRLAPADISGIKTGVNLRVILFALAASLITGFVFTLGPGLAASRRDPSMLLRVSSRSRTGVTRGLRLLVAGQTALATLLLVGAALLATSLHQLNRVDAGLDPQRRATFDLVLPTSRYTEAERIIAFYDALQEQIHGLPGVESSALVRHLPLRDGFRRENVIREEDLGKGADPREHALGIAVQAGTPGTVRTLGVPLLAGRDIESADRQSTMPVALLNRAAAHALWPGQNPIGKRVRATFAPQGYPLVTVVGIYGNVRSAGLSTEPAPEIILPIAQAGPWQGWIRQMTLIVKTESNPATTLATARSAIRKLDSSIPVENFSTMEDIVRTSTQRERFLTSLLAAFAALAVIIAGVGVFGVVSFTVARQKREFAIRSALGARRIAILGGVLRTSTAFAAGGAAIGVALATAATPAMSEFLYNVAPRDLLVLVGVPCGLTAIALASALIPALRATRLPPGHLLHEAD